MKKTFVLTTMLLLTSNLLATNVSEEIEPRLYTIKDCIALGIYPEDIFDPNYTTEDFNKCYDLKDAQREKVATYRFAKFTARIRAEEKAMKGGYKKFYKYGKPKLITDATLEYYFIDESYWTQIKKVNKKRRALWEDAKIKALEREEFMKKARILFDKPNLKDFND